MNRPVIEVIVSPRGEITIDAVDFVGADCEAATRFLEEALGTVAAKRRKPAFHSHRTTVRRQNLGG